MSEATVDAGEDATPADRGVGIVRRHRVTSFVALTLALSWGWWAFAWVVLVGSEGLTRVLVAPGAFGPAVAGVVVTWAAGDDVRAWLRSLARWRVPARWYLGALAVPLAIATVGTALLVVDGVAVDLGVLPTRAALFPVVLAITVVAGGGQEEPGWRGFALPRLQADYGALTASLAVGVVWAVWHLPLFMFGAPRNATGSFGLYVVTVLAISVVLTHLYNASGGSVLVAALAHAGVNASGLLFPVGQGTASELGLVVDLAVTVPLLILALAVIVRYGPATLSPGGRTTSTTDGVASGGRNREPQGG